MKKIIKLIKMVYLISQIIMKIIKIVLIKKFNNVKLIKFKIQVLDKEMELFNVYNITIINNKYKYKIQIMD
jgi:hypothetical protein